MSDFNKIISGDQPVLVDFFAEWCGPCKAMAPILKELASAVNGKARILKIDVDKNPTVASHYNIRSVPTLILFKKGKVVWQHSGVCSSNDLQGIINQHLSF